MFPRWQAQCDRPSPDPAARARVGYLLRAPAAGPESSAHHFQRTVVTPGKEGRGSSVAGEQRVDLEHIHWADEDGDFQVGDAEVLDALERIEAVSREPNRVC